MKPCSWHLIFKIPEDTKFTLPYTLPPLIYEFLPCLSYLTYKTRTRINPPYIVLYYLSRPNKGCCMSTNNQHH